MRKSLKISWKLAAFAGNLLVLLLLLFAYLGSLTDPETLALFSFFALIFPVILFVSVLFFLIAALRYSRWAYVFMFAIALGGIHVRNTLRITNIDRKSQQKGVHILSYNVRGFDRYDWVEGKTTREKILNFLKGESADIVCLQEFYTGKDHVPQDSLLSQGYKYSHLAFTDKPGKIYLSGVATFSRYPIIHKGAVSVNHPDRFIFSDIKIEDDTIRVFNVHLQSVYFGTADYRVIDSLQNQPDSKGVKAVLAKLRNGFQNRAPQVKTIAEMVRNSPYPVVLCGDFNDTPQSFTYRKVKGCLFDAFTESGEGFGNTIVRGPYRFRIDYILYSRYFKSNDFQTISLPYSDHYPIRCFLEKRS